MIGSRLGPYELVEEIGAGAMAIIYRAYQPTMDRYVAVKVIDASHVRDDEAVARFQREARLVARLEHLHILPVYDFDGTHDPPYIVMRYLEGGTVRDVLAQGPLPLDEVAYLIQQVGSALHYAHRQGIVHRDVKPANVLIDTEGNAFVSDFGIARILDESARRGKSLTMTGSSVGTPAYMAPEQIQGQAHVDERVDIYALGVLLFEMVTGELPFQGPSLVQLLYQHLKDPVPDPRALRPELPPTLGNVIQQAMAKEPQDRFGTAEAFVAAAIKAIGAGAAAPLAIRAAARASRQEILRQRETNREEIEHTLAQFRATRDGAWKTPSSEGPSGEHRRNVTVLSVIAADYLEIVEEVEGGVAARQAMDALWDAAREIVAARGGQVYTCTEDSLLALWGVAGAREDDPENAIRAALEIRGALRELSASLPGAEGAVGVPARFGLNSGTALLAPTGDDGAFTVSGATVSLANRVAQRADGEILITHDTYRDVQGVFDMRVAGPLQVRGRPEPLPLYTVTDEKPRAFRRTVRDVEGVATKMVGRRAELQLLQDVFEDAIEESETQVVTIVGQAGIGKSRLLAQFDERSDLHPVAFRLFQGRATSNMTRRPYALLRDVMSFRFEILDSDPFEVIRDKLEDGVALLTGSPNPEMAHMIGHLCGFDFSASEHIQGLLIDPQQLISRARQWFKRLFMATATLSPILIELEDIHHADDASLDLFNELVTEYQELPLLLVCLARPALLERRPAWGSGQELHHRIYLEPLTRRESRLLAREILQKVPDLSKVLRDRLVDQAEGNPFYMEEMVKVLIEDRVIVLELDDTWRVEASRLENLRVPPSLDRLLQVRFDTLLYPEKLALQRAAVVGRVFYDTAVVALGEADGTHLEDVAGVLGLLAERGFIHARETSAFAGHTEYVFDQQMMRDSIYDKLLRQQARDYHAAVADWLVEVAGERVAEYYPLIAEHYEKGGRAEQAARYLRLAGERSYSVSALADARAAFERALSLLPAASVTHRLPVLLSLGEVLNEAGDLSEARRVLDDALSMAIDVDKAGAQANALYLLAQNATRVGHWDVALAHLDQAQELVRGTAERGILARVLYGLGDARYRLGQPGAARSACHEALAVARETGDRLTEMNALNRLGAIEMLSGRAPEAARLFEECRTLAREVGNRYREARALGNLGEVARLQGDYALASQHTEEALAISQEVEESVAIIVGAVNLASLRIHAGLLREAQGLLAEAAQAARRSGSITWLAATAGFVAFLRVAQGRIDEALALLGLAWAHPALSSDVRQDTEYWIMPRLEETLTPEEIQAGMAKGQALDLDEVIDAFLAEAT
jgi:serine/threonine protein kinase/tetratricopeptide (TPR) repeat protein